MAQGEGSPLLSLYCTRTGKTLSRGAMPEPFLSLAASYDFVPAADGTEGGVWRHRIAAANRRGEVYGLKACF